MKKKELKSQRPYKISTTSIGELVKAQAKYGNPKAQKSAKKFLKMVNKKG